MKINNETKIGAMVVGILAILAILTIRAGDFSLSREGYALKVRFQNIDGVALNSPVMLNGFEVGRVQNIQISYTEQPAVELTLWIRGKTKILKSVNAQIRNMGFMGEKYVGLVMKEGQAEFLNPGDVISGKEPVSFESVLSEGEGIVVNLKELSANLNERLKVNSQAIDDVIAKMNSTMTHVASISENIDERFAVNKLLVDEMVKNAQVSSKNLEELSFDLKENPWKLLYRPKKKN